jgi:hypothetical protein
MSDGENTGTGVAMDEAEATEYFKQILEGAHYLGTAAEVAEVWNLVHAFPAIAEACEVLGPVGWAATAVQIAWAGYDAVNAANNNDGNMGKCYGVLFQVHGMPDAAPPHVDALYLDPERSYWYAGLTEGRQKITDTAVHNRVLLLCAQHGDAAVLNTLWQEVVQGQDILPSVVLSWPTPGTG